jgi:dienelactone hydrolase
MRKAGVDWYFVSYGGAVHSFTNPDSGNDPSKGAAYNEKADRRSWEEMKDFFAETFK